MAKETPIGSAIDTAQGRCSREKLDLDEWIIQVEQELTNEKATVDQSAAIIFRVPKPLRDSSEHYYIPRLVSIGPYHFGKPELTSMEQHKSEAVRRMQSRIQKRFPGCTIKSIVEREIMKMDKTIRECYDEEIPYNSKALAWIVTRDACFLYEFLLNYIRGFAADEERVVPDKYDLIFDGCIKNPTWESIMDDFLLLENQVPLFILEQLLRIEMGCKVAAKQKLNDMIQKLLSVTLHVVFSWDAEQANEGWCHLLEVFYLTMVGSNYDSYYQKAVSFEEAQLFSFSCNSISMAATQAIFKLNFILSCSYWMRGLGFLFPTMSHVSKDNVIPRGRRLKLPSAVELHNAGVKLHPVLLANANAIGESVAAIRWIRFDENTSTLYLPEVYVKPVSLSLIRNLVAMEVTTDKYGPSPITQFVKFMDELIDSAEDVALLRKRGIINNFLGSNEEVAQLFNSVNSEIVSHYWCKPIDDARIGLAKYQKKKHKILWSEFVAAYFSKPWLVAGLLGATLLLLMTVLQVFCLFYSCNKR